MKLGQNKKKKEVKFTSTTAPSTISVSLAQTKLQIEEEEPFVKMVETSRSPCKLNINLKNYDENVSSLYVKLLFFKKDKKNMKPEEEFEPKGYINIKDKNAFEFSLETQKEYSFQFEFLKTNLAKKQDFFTLKICFFDNEYAQEHEFIFESPNIIVCSKLDDSSRKKRQLTENENENEQLEKKKKKNYTDDEFQKFIMEALQTLEDVKKFEEMLEKHKKNFEMSKEVENCSENEISEFFQNLVDPPNDEITSIFDYDDDYATPFGDDEFPFSKDEDEIFSH